MSWEREGGSSTFGEVAEEVIGGLSVGGEEETTSYQLQIILLSYSSVVVNPGGNYSSIAA